jgi:arabinofuranosyltransferase
MAGRHYGRRRRGAGRRNSTWVMLKKDWVAYAVPLALLGILKAALHVGLCDDAFITLRVAENLATGRGMVFNPSEYIYICTTPAWALLIAAGRVVLGDTTLAVKVLGTIFEATLLISMVRLSSDGAFGKATGVLAGILLLTNPAFVLTSFSGMELPLALTCLVVVSDCVVRRRFTTATLLAGFLPWIRFDGVVPLAATLALTVWLQRGDLRTKPLHVARSLAPATLGVASHAIFGLVLFHNWVPTSVRAKALTAPKPLSADWLEGALRVGTEFASEVIGQSAHWYIHTTPFVVLPLLSAAGAYFLFSRKDSTLVPLLVLTGAHVLAFIGSGSSYAIHFPWYFVPILPACSLLGGAGLAGVSAWAANRFPALGTNVGRAVLCMVFLVGWVAVAKPSIEADAEEVRKTWEDRERAYAATAVWAGEHLGKHALIAANEIGAIGYYLPPDDSILDLFGLLRTNDTLKTDYVDLVRDRKPECILTKLGFSYKKPIEAALPDQYSWFRFRNVGIGVRSDLANDARPSNRAIQALYKSVAMNREYRWEDR